MREVGILGASTVGVPVDAEAYRERFANRFRRVGTYVEAAQLGAAGVLDAHPGLPRDLAVFIGTGLANLDTIVPLIEAIFHPRAPRCSPLAFARSVGNAAAFYVAQAFELEGPNVTVSQEEISFEAALLDAWLAVRSGEVEHALVGGLDVLVDGDGAQRVRMGAEGVPGTVAAGAAFLLLGAGGPWVLDEVRIGAFDPLDGVHPEATVLRGWRAGGLEVDGPPVEHRLFGTASGVRFCEALNDERFARITHVQRHREGPWARISARRR
ncbi:MAG: beta-ketoacyl synthase N-terminal-like domain-containing protein [Myxococcota bacterium]